MDQTRPPKLTRTSSGGRPPVLFTLSVRQKETLSLIAEGMSNREIARRLHINVKSVENYINQVYSFYGCEGGGSARVQVTLVYLADQGIALDVPETVLRFRAGQTVARIHQLYLEAQALLNPYRKVE